MVETNKKEKYQVAVAKYLIGDFPIEQLPGLACDALEDGIEGSATAQIAGLKNPGYFDVQGLLPNFFNELGVSALTKQEAGWFLAKNIAGKIVSGGIDPEMGAKELERIWIKLEYSLERLKNFSLADDLIESLPFTVKKSDLLRVRDKMRGKII